ncbi:carotenoid oxygenase family protein [Pseudoxanthomonas putridarboris]|uniref:Carotenoid oxygenase family protein n=1 Tax=Pseudoxanthomonas putridarboris TaxID=752605 RepID=A0ABU9J2M4_9GAMM
MRTVDSRRRFLRTLLSGATTLAIAPALLRSEAAFAGDPARFAEGLRQHPWLAGWKSVGAESLGPTTVELDGRLPDGFAGTLYRNGPAWTERAGFRYEHWFDGDGMVHGWRFGKGRVTHQARMVATPKFTREQQAGRFLYPTAGTSIPDMQPVRNNDDANVANTSVTVIDGRLFALNEAGSAFELDPDQLTTIGPVTWRPDLAALPFSAHPLVDRDGSSWNFGSLSLMGGNGLLVWHIGADGRLVSADVLETPVHGYLHSFAMTERHLVFALIPFRYAEGRGAFFERLRFQPDQALRIAVVDKNAPSEARWFEADFAAVYHFADAHERSGRIVVRAVQHADLDAARSPMRAAMNGRAETHGGNGTLRELVLDLRNGRARWEDTGIAGIEFPVFDARTPLDRAARLYAPAQTNESTVPYFNAVASFDLARGRQQVHRYGRDVLVEEHLFVPRPGGRRPDEGWLVGTLLDGARGRSGIAVLDAQRVGDGPLAQAWLPYAFPLGFHGHFAAV